ncbi:acyltransferase domain-containing protein, partial [Plantactinospora sp. S1510]
MSGRSAAALARVAGGLAAELSGAGPVVDPAGVAVTLAGRSGFGVRAAVVGTSVPQLVAGLTALAADEPGTGVVRGVVGDSGRPVFVFPGQGGQWAGMAVGLLDSSPVFASRMAECEAALTPFVDWSLVAVLRQEPGAPGLDRVDVVQPVLWAVMVSLATVWESAGVTPGAVVGHSQGEIAAAVVAGLLDLDDAARVVAMRSRALRELSSTGGGMLAVADTAQAVTDRLGEDLTIAVVNAPASVVVSGPVPALQRLADRYTEEQVRTRMLPVDYASHGPAVDPVHDRLAADLATITTGPGRPEVTFWSTVTATPATPTDLNADYWWRNLRQPVQFQPTIDTLLSTGHHTYIEISPHPVLTTAIEQTAEHHDTTCTTIATLHRDQPDHHQLLTCLAHAWTTGLPIN